MVTPMVTPPPVRIVLADDHAQLRAEIRRALEADGCVVCGEAATAEDAVALTVGSRPDLALLDIRMPGNGIEAARQISLMCPETKVVMLTQSEDEDDLFDSLRAGAAGYLPKNTDPRTLAVALRGVLAGEAALPPRLVARILEEFREPAARWSMRKPPAAAKLSPREWEIMQLLCQGHSTDDVAKQLFISATTVRVHVSTVLRKLRVKNRATAFDLLRVR